MNNYIQVPTGEDAAKRIIDSHNRGQSTSFIDVLIFLAWFSTLVVSIANNFKLRELPIENVVSYLRPEDIKQRRLVENILAEIRGCIGCHRVAIGMFHNGTAIGGSKHFDRMSVVYESLAQGVSSIKEIVKDIPITKIYSEVERDIDFGRGKFTFYNKNEMSLQKCIIHLDVIGVDCLINRLLFNKYGVFGIVQMQWITPLKANPLDNENDKIQLERIFNALENKLQYVIEHRKLPRKFF